MALAVRNSSDWTHFSETKPWNRTVLWFQPAKTDCKLNWSEEPNFWGSPYYLSSPFWQNPLTLELWALLQRTAEVINRQEWCRDSTESSIFCISLQEDSSFENLHCVQGSLCEPYKREVPLQLGSKLGSTLFSIRWHIALCYLNLAGCFLREFTLLQHLEI